MTTVFILVLWSVIALLHIVGYFQERERSRSLVKRYELIMANINLMHKKLLELENSLRNNKKKGCFTKTKRGKQ